MGGLAIWSTMQARPGREKDAERFLVEEVFPLIEQEPGTTRFTLLSHAPGRFAVFDTFADASAFEAHLNGPVPKLLASKGATLFTGEPTILRCDVVVDKTPIDPL
jgi:quinol monooxygenase YgiN